MDEIKDKIVINELEPFDKQVDAVLSGADTTSSHLEVLKVTPPLLRMVGVPNLPILMTAHHVKTITQESGNDTANYHGLGAELVKQLPELISDPVMIMDSISPDAKAKNSVVIVTQTVDKENRPIIGAIKLAGKGYVNSIEIDANVLTSAYGKDNFQTFIERNIEHGSILYVDKEKSQELAKIPGIQFPDNFATLDFDTIIRKTNAFVNSKEQENLGSAENSRDGEDHARALPGELKQNTKKKEEENMDIPTTDEGRIVAEARERARHLVEETGEPHVTIEWSENAELEAGEVLTLSAADKKLVELDRKHYGGTYDKVKLHIDYIKDGKADSYEDCRFDIGDEQQGLISHIQDYWQFYLENKNWRKRLESQHSADYVKTTFEEYDRMANDVAPFLKRHAELSDMITKAQSQDLTSEEIEEVKAFVRKSREELNGSIQSAAVLKEEEHKENINEREADKNDEETPASEPLSYRDKVTKIRDEMAQTLLDYIEQNPQNWQKGWNNLTSPINGKTNNSYRGFNALYLTLVGMSRGYDDPRWVTYNQAKDLGASIKKGEKSSPVLFFEFYDRLTKKAYDARTTKDMTDEDRAAYEKENVYAVLKYSSVFNASQCVNFPERDLESLKMSEDDRANQSELIEMIIANSAAPVNYDGGNQAFYRPSTDSIHLPAIEAFNSMQDYYATALHEIAHSTGHASRLHRDLTGAFGSPSYAIEELRAELACVYMQIEQGIQLDGKHIENHAAYLSSWLEAAKNDKSVFFKAASDAQKIADYVSAHYVQSVQVDELELEEENEAQSSSDNTPQAENSSTETKKSEEEQKAVLESRLNANVREWYMSAFPTDELGAELDGGLTFNDVLAALSKGDNIYDVLGAYDSVVRERLFGHLAEIQDKTYEEIYDSWMNAETQQTKEHKEEDEYRALQIVLNRVWNGETLPEYVALKNLDGADYLINVGDLVIKYGGEYGGDVLPEGYYLITPAVQIKFAELQSKYERREHKENKLLDENVKQWYTTTFPNDNVGSALDEYITFADINESVFNPTEQNANIYEVLGGNATSEARDRVFNRLAEIKGITYNEIFNAWVEFDYLVKIAKQKHEEEKVDVKDISANSNVNEHTTEQGEHKKEESATARFSTDELEILRKSKQFYQTAEKLDNEMGATISIVSELTNGADNLAYGELNDYQTQAFQIFIRDHEDEIIELMTATEIQQALEERGANYTKETRNGHQVLDITKDEENRNIALVKRTNDFMIAVGYNTDDGTWQQGYYDFKDQKTAEEFREKHYPTNVHQQQKPEQKPSQNTPKREWLNVELPEGSLGKRYGANTMVKMPEGEYSYYCLYIPTKLIKTVGGKQQMRVASDFTYRLNNDGRQVELTGQELRDSFAGMPIGKQYKRVAPSRAYAKVFADLEKNVPEEMKAMPNWCVYRTWQKDEDKKGKVLKSAITGEGVRKNNNSGNYNPSDFTDFTTALKYAKENSFAGVSFLLEAKNGITCIDLDKCVLSAETDEMKERATKLIDSLKGTYMERSTSGNGVHIFIKDDILKGGKYRSTAVDAQKGDLEVFDNQRIISMTGNMFSETNTLTRAGSAATVYLRKELGEQKQRAPVGDSHPRPSNGMQLSDSELVRWIRSSKKASDFDALYSGKGLSGDKSNDDAKLAHILLYFSGGDKDQAFRIMRESGQNRADKPDSYYRHTIEKMDEMITEYAKLPTSFGADGAGKSGGRRYGGGNNRGSQA